MFEFRHILVRMRLGDSDRALAKAGLIGRPKAKVLRTVAEERGWLDPARPLPEDVVLAQALGTPRAAASAQSHLRWQLLFGLPFRSVP